MKKKNNPFAMFLLRVAISMEKKIVDIFISFNKIKQDVLGKSKLFALW